MNAIVFLGQWVLRSAALIGTGALLVWALRVKDPAIRLAAWTALLVASLAIPLMTAVLPKAAVPVGAVHMSLPPAMPLAMPTVRVATLPPATRQFDWPLAAMWFYVAVAGVLVLRVAAGLMVSRRLLRASRPTGRAIGGAEIRESDAASAPAVIGVVSPAVVLPADWREWEAAKLEAVAAHELSHVRRHDPAVQLLSAIHRALLWVSPPSWFLHKCIVRAAEDVSDDAAVAATRDRASYAEVLLQFMQAPRANWGCRHGAIRQAGGAHPSHSGGNGAFAWGDALGADRDYRLGRANGVSRGGGRSADASRSSRGTGRARSRSLACSA